MALSIVKNQTAVVPPPSASTARKLKSDPRHPHYVGRGKRQGPQGCR
jgi:hypothetical protein